jgi:ubiquinone/menaquinone biosynthesis C-methylase UbiE
MAYESTKTVSTVYDQMGSGFDDLVEKTPFLINCTRLYNLSLQNFIQAALSGEISMESVLDVGCGSGAQSAALAPYAKAITGIDLSEKLIGVARDRCQSFNHVRFDVGNACQLSYPDRSFDFIISYGDVLSHIVEGYETAVSEIARVAKPGAIVTLETDTKWNFGIFYHPDEMMQALSVKGIGHATRCWEGMRFKTFTYRELKGLLEKNRLEIVSCRGHNIFASLIPDRYLLEKEKRTVMGRLALSLGSLDLRLSGVYPFSRFGFNFIITARKKG